MDLIGGTWSPDQVSAASSVVQTFGSLLAIGVTAWIAFRSERGASRREREARDREDAARKAADERADDTIKKAAAAEAARQYETLTSVASMCIHAVDTAITSFEAQRAAAAAHKYDDSFHGDNWIHLNWSRGSTSIVTLRTLLPYTHDPMLALFIAQAIDSLSPPSGGLAWDARQAVSMLYHLINELIHIRDGMQLQISRGAALASSQGATPI